MGFGGSEANPERLICRKCAMRPSLLGERVCVSCLVLVGSREIRIRVGLGTKIDGFCQIFWCFDYVQCTTN